MKRAKPILTNFVKYVIPDLFLIQTTRWLLAVISKLQIVKFMRILSDSMVTICRSHWPNVNNAWRIKSPVNSKIHA